ncbi:MAG: hypothetical protein ABIN24_09210 [Dyadobacter sp.]
MKKFLYLILILFVSAFQSCKEKDPEIDFTSGFVGEHDVKYVIRDTKTQTIIGSDSLILAKATITFIRKDNNTLKAEVYINDPRMKINETFDVFVGADPDPVDYINLPPSTAKLDGKYLLQTVSPNLVSAVAVNLYENKKIIGGLTYFNTMGDRWLTFK